MNNFNLLFFSHFLFLVSITITIRAQNKKLKAKYEKILITLRALFFQKQLEKSIKQIW